MKRTTVVSGNPVGPGESRASHSREHQSEFMDEMYKSKFEIYPIGAYGRKNYFGGFAKKAMEQPYEQP